MRKTVCLAAILAVCAWAGSALAEEDGKSLYDKKCAMCHGTDGVAKSMAKGSRNFNDAAFTASLDDIVKVTMEGKGKMPKMEGKLTADQAKLVAEYVKTLQPKK